MLLATNSNKNKRIRTRTLRARGVVYISPFPFHSLSRPFVASYVLPFSCISFFFFPLRPGSISLHHICFLSLCVQFNPASTSTAIVIMQFLYSFSCPNLIVATPMPLFFFLLLPLSPASGETQRRLVSASLPVAHGPSSTSLPCIERSPRPSHALHLHLLPLSIPRTALYVAVLVHHLFFPHAPAFDRECNKSRRSSHT